MCTRCDSQINPTDRQYFHGFPHSYRSTKNRISTDDSLELYQSLKFTSIAISKRSASGISTLQRIQETAKSLTLKPQSLHHEINRSTFKIACSMHKQECHFLHQGGFRSDT